MEGLHHDTVLDVPRSTNKVEDPGSSPEKKDEADQQQQDNTGDKTLDNDAPKTSDATPVESISDHTVSEEDTDTVPEKNDDGEERQVEGEALVSSLDDNASEEMNEASRTEDSAATLASSEEPHAYESRGSPVSGELEALLPEGSDGGEGQSEKEGESSSHDDSKEMNDSSPSSTPNENDPQADTSFKPLAEDNDASTVSNEEKTLSSETSEKCDKPQLQEKVIPVSKGRANIAVSLIDSKTQIPHFYLQHEINSGPLLDTRTAINKKFSEQPSELGGFNVTINDLVLKACAEAITWVPEINASWKGDHIKQHGAIHLAFSVAVEDGLITPVIHDAETKHLRSLSRKTKQLISKARTQQLSSEEMSGSTFTVTNLGMYGIDFFSSIINPPNAAILSVGATKAKPIVDELGRIVPGRRMMLGLSCDHRVVDGAIGSSYLKALAEILENPTLMLV
ncbi:MAG: dihydrolipoamide acetyltransferase [Opitutae bacterium]|nr:dihydrolipoamide acetyltransferase [Opitutae bacterium]